MVDTFQESAEGLGLRWAYGLGGSVLRMSSGRLFRASLELRLWRFGDSGFWG